MGRVAQAARWSRQALGLDGHRCPLCGVPGREAGLCPACAKALAPRLGGFCPRCARRFGLDGYEPTVCSDCRETPPPWQRLYFHGAYDGQLRELILTYKFATSIQHARLFQDLALAAFQRQADARPDMVVPVPLHWRRLVWRGFNQSLEMARRLAREEGIALAPSAMKRTRHTAPQSTLTVEERLTNLDNAFRAKQELVSGRHVLLVDDVMTTGSTLRECAQVLLGADATRVDVLVLTRT